MRHAGSDILTSDVRHVACSMPHPRCRPGACCMLHVACCMLHVACSMKHAAGVLTSRQRCWTFVSHVACCMLHVACCMLHVACCMLHVACCMLHAACCMLHVACCMSHVACCMLHAACCMLCLCVRMRRTAIASHAHWGCGHTPPPMVPSQSPISLTPLSVPGACAPCWSPVAL